MKVIRDNLHGDIEFSREEMRLLHTAGFERLHGLKQLGLTYLVYPGAKHSRFEHVLGVMHIATEIANRMGESGQFFVGPDGQHLRRVLRFAALLHDMGHVPFGHTLEDEMPVIPKHDSPSTAGVPSRMDTAVSEVLRDSDNEAYLDPVLQVLRAIAESKNDNRLYPLVDAGDIKPEYLIIADIIGNTICADLLDYIKRDHRMTGIRATYDSRIFRYFGVGDHRFNGRSYKRVVINLVKNGRVRNDALADLLDILKLRYNLSDKVLYHPKKCSAGGMLIKAFAEAGLAKKDAALLKHSDDSLLDGLADHPLVKMIRRWELFKQVFVCGLGNVNSFDERRTKTELVQNLHEDLALRTRIENIVERDLGLSHRETPVLIYCPSPKMTLKLVRTLVRWKDGTVRRLNEIKHEDDPLTAKQVELLQDSHPQLWKLYLFVHPKLRSRGHEIQRKFYDVLKKEAKLNVTCDPAFQYYLENLSKYQLGSRVEEELRRTKAFTALPHSKQMRIVAMCHDKLPPDLSDDSYVEPEVTVLASRTDEAALRGTVRKIIRSVLRRRQQPRRRN